MWGDNGEFYYNKALCFNKYLGVYYSIYKRAQSFQMQCICSSLLNWSFFLYIKKLEQLDVKVFVNPDGNDIEAK
jgi:hypothetical protein